MECTGCPHERVTFRPGLAFKAPVRCCGAEGAVGGWRAAAGGSGKVSIARAGFRLLRPPGVRSEDEFLKRCVRCGECMRSA